MAKRPTRNEIAIALADAVQALLDISQEQHSSPDERALLRKKATQSSALGGLVLVAEIEFKSRESDGLQEVIDATKERLSG
jgi:hypothetical protein